MEEGSRENPPKYVLSPNMLLIGQGQDRTSRKRRKLLSPQCRTSIGNNSLSVKHMAVMSACSMGFTDTADRLM